jgi:hypothetical protein
MNAKGRAESAAFLLIAIYLLATWVFCCEGKV